MPKHRSQIDMVNEPMRRALEEAPARMQRVMENLSIQPVANPVRESLGRHGITLKELREALK